MYEIIFTDQSKKQITSLNIKTRERIGASLERLKFRPHKFVKKLYNSKYYRLRVDNYRVILDIKDMQLIIYVIEIGERGRIYKS